MKLFLAASQQWEKLTHNILIFLKYSVHYFEVIEVKGGQLVLTAAQPNSDDDGIAGNDDKDDDEAIDDDYYCFICLLANAWSALLYATCCIFISRPDGT